MYRFCIGKTPMDCIGMVGLSKVGRFSYVTVQFGCIYIYIIWAIPKLTETGVSLAKLSGNNACRLKNLNPIQSHGSVSSSSSSHSHHRHHHIIIIVVVIIITITTIIFFFSFFIFSLFVFFLFTSFFFNLPRWNIYVNIYVNICVYKSYNIM